MRRLEHPRQPQWHQADNRNSDDDAQRTDALFKRIESLSTDKQKIFQTGATQKSPELRKALQSGETVFIPEAQDDPTLKHVRGALAMRRVDGIRFAAGVFTNLTRDHLDFHQNMENYFVAKRRLFEMLPADAPAVINADDPRAASLVEIAGRPVTYAVAKDADVTPGPLSFALRGLEFDVRMPQGVAHVKSRLVGKPNVYNILAAAGTTAAVGIPIKAIERGLQKLSDVPGRFEVVSSPDADITVVVDYAHTDDALRNLLETARALAPRRLITVFGAGGDRDKTKRPLMGMVAARLSDVVVITSDNPRGEEPARIIEEVKRGAEPESRQGNAEVLTIADRRDAILQAVVRASRGDVVLIAGKGHEKYQEIGGRITPFDDVAVAREALEARRVKSRVG